MASQIICSLLIFFASHFLITKTTSQQNDPLFLGWNCGYSAGNYTLNSTYHSNLLNAFANLTSLSTRNTFSNITTGTDQDRVYALYDCRLDLTLQMCNDCIKDATKNLLQLCPSKEAISTYEILHSYPRLFCIFSLNNTYTTYKYSIFYPQESFFTKNKPFVDLNGNGYANRPIISLMELKPYYIECDINIPDGGELTRLINPIFTQLITQTTSENSSRYFGVKETKYFEYQNIYCLVQCTPDINREQCNECLMDALNATLQCSHASGMVSLQNRPSCQMRYDVSQFYNLSSAPPPLASTTILSPPPLASYGGQRLLSYERFILIVTLFCLCLL